MLQGDGKTIQVWPCGCQQQGYKMPQKPVSLQQDRYLDRQHWFHISFACCICRHWRKPERNGKTPLLEIFILVIVISATSIV